MSRNAENNGLERANPLRVAITGGATNIGKAISLRFLQAGARVAVGQPETSVIEPLRDAYPEQVVPLVLRLEDPLSCRRFIEEAGRELGGLDVLVNNAALCGPQANRAFLEMDDEHIDSLTEVNFKGVVRCSLAAARLMKEAGSAGVIIQITSINAFRPQHAAGIYAACKAALTSITKTMAKELAPHRIRTVAVAPGDINTDAYEDILREMEASGLKNEIVGQTPLGQGKPEDVAAAVYFLASPEAAFMSGVTLVVDGGLLA